MSLFWLCIIGYFVGSIPTGFLLIKIYGNVDIRHVGSHSTGATNVLRSGHKILALLTLLGDALKGLMFTVFASVMSDDPYLLMAVFCCLLGHVYPVWLGFKGGKGVATSAGIFVVLSPLFALISVAIWAFFAKFVKISSIASIAMVLSFSMMCTYGFVVNNTEFSTFLFSIAVLIFLIFTHKKNIGRIIHKNETAVEI